MSSCASGRVALKSGLSWASRSVSVKATSHARSAFWQAFFGGCIRGGYCCRRLQGSGDRQTRPVDQGLGVKRTDHAHRDEQKLAPGLRSGFVFQCFRHQGSLLVVRGSGQIPASDLVDFATSVTLVEQETFGSDSKCPNSGDPAGADLIGIAKALYFLGQKADKRLANAHLLW